MTRSRKQRKLRKQRQAAASSQHDEQYSVCPSCGKRHAPDDGWDAADDDVGPDDFFFPFPEEAFQQWKDCEESIFLPNGVMLRFFADKFVVDAPEALRDTNELSAIIVEFMLEHYGDDERCEEILRNQGPQAAVDFLQRRGLEIHIGFWLEKADSKKRR